MASPNDAAPGRPDPRTPQVEVPAARPSVRVGSVWPSLLADSLLEVDGDAIASNLAVLRRRLAAGTELCPVVKCDAYGLGAVPVVRLMARHGVERVAVFRAAEALELCAAGAAAEGGRPAAGGPAWPRVLLLMPLRPDVAAAIERRAEDLLPLRTALEHGRLALSVHDAGDVDRAAAIAVSIHRPVAVHLFLDTGMHRGGAPCAVGVELVERLRAAPGLVLEGLSTHLASPEDPGDSADRQVARFDRVEQAVTAFAGVPPLRHVASTFGVLRRRSLHRELVRVGLAWTGHGPAWMQVPHAPIDLRPCVRWLSRVSEVVAVPAGDAAGYGRTWTTPRDTRLALVPVGYGDGLASNLGADDERGERGRVAIVRPDGTRLVAPIVGRVNMDQVTVDVGRSPVARGDLVEVIGDAVGAPHGVDAHARAAGLPPHEVLCRISSRVTRRYLRFDVAPLVEPSALVASATGDLAADVAGAPQPDSVAARPGPDREASP